MSTILQHDAAAKLVDTISSACNDDSVRATLQNYDGLGGNNTPARTTPTGVKIPPPNDEDVDEMDINDTSYTSLEEYTGSVEDDLSPTESTPPLPLSDVRPALAQLTAAAKLIDRLTDSYDAEDAQDLLGDTNAWHSFEDYTETIDALYDRYRAVLYEFADAAGQAQQQKGEGESEQEVSAETYREGMQALARVLRGSCDPLPYRLRQVHVALVGSAGTSGKGGGHVQPHPNYLGDEARVLLRAANDRCIEEADDFLAYYATVRRLFLHIVASEAKAVMVMAVALQHGGVPAYIHHSDVTMARELLSEQDAFLDRIIPSPVVRLSELILTSLPTGNTSPPQINIRAHNSSGGSQEVRPSADEGSEIVCTAGTEQQRPFAWTLEATQPLPGQDDIAVGRYTFHLRSSGSASPSSSKYLGVDDKGNIINTTYSSAPPGTWRIAAVQIEHSHLHNGKATIGGAMPVAFRLQYRSSDLSSPSKSHGRWLVLREGCLSLRELEGESQDFLFDISPVES